MEKKIFLASPHMMGNEEKYVKDVFDTNWLAPLGPYVNRLETDICNYVGSKKGAALSAGTAAIHLALKLLNIKEGDYVFCSTLTFAASANPIIYQNAIPVFIDSEPETYNMSPKALEKAFEKYTPKAVIVVHLYGNPAYMDEIMEICNKHNVPVIEDAAESLGATYKGKHTGTFGKFGIYSFNGNKIITTTGGGMLVSEDEEAIKKAIFWATQSRENERHYEHKEIGYNYRLSNVSAAIGVGQLEQLDKKISLKKKIYEYYKEAFKTIKEIEMLPINNNGTSNYWLSCLRIDENSKVKPLDIMLELESHNIEARPIWKPMHLQPVFKDYDFFNHNDKGISVSEDIFNNGICMPSDTRMDDEDIEKVCTLVKGLWKR